METKNRLILTIVVSIFTVSAGFIVLNPNLEARGSSARAADLQSSQRMLSQLLKIVQENYVEDVPVRQLYLGAAKGLFAGLKDPYSDYFSAEEMYILEDTSSGSFVGVGLYISRQAKYIYSESESLPASDQSFRARYANYIEVVAPISQTPAYRSGIHAGDFITAIDGKSTKDMSIDEVVNALRGPTGSVVELSIVRRGDVKITKKIRRAQIEVPPVEYTMMSDNIGYLKILKWNPNTSASVKEAFDFYKDNNYKSLVIDVRGNPGGLLSQVIEVSDFLLSKGGIVSIKGRRPQNEQTFMAQRTSLIDPDTPMVLLINEASASASEILAGALKDNNRAILLGKTTYGKGLVQEVIEYGEGDGVKLTTAKYYTPSGINIDKIGIEPHKTIAEPALSENDKKHLEEIWRKNLVSNFAEANPGASATKIDNFIANLKTQGIDLSDRLLKKIIHLELNRTIDNPPIFDLEFDLALKEAKNILINNLDIADM